MTEVPESALYEGVSVDVGFSAPGPTFGDLFLICGTGHPDFPPTNRYRFAELDQLQFGQVDDYFGVRTSSGEGDDVAVWLYPVIQGDPVDHDPGPFDAVRLEYCVLRNPVYRSDHYLNCVAAVSAMGVTTRYRNRDVDLGAPADLTILRDDIRAIARHWMHQGVTVGSDAALLIDF